VSGRIVQPTSVAVTPDGSTAVVGGAVHTEDFEVVGGRVELWDTVGPRRRGSVDLPWDVLGVAITPDGRRAVLNGGKGFAVVDLVAGRLLLQPRELTQMDPADGTSGAEVSPDGRWAALARNDEVVLVDLSTGEVARRRALATRERAVVQALAWTADSQRLAAGTSEGFLHVVDATTLADVAPRRQIAVWVVDLELSRDGRLMASAGSDGDITLWDTASWQPYGQPITDDRQWAWVTFTEDGRRLRAFFEEKEMVDIDITPQAWVAAGCNAAGRNLTADEAAVIVPGRGPRPTCPQLG
jgi:WD40 repeat protein